MSTAVLKLTSGNNEQIALEQYLPMSLATKKMVTRFSKQVEANEEDEGGEIDLFSRNRQSALYLAQKVLIQR